MKLLYTLIAYLRYRDLSQKREKQQNAKNSCTAAEWFWMNPMYKLKTNCSRAELAILFQSSKKTIKLYFADTVQLLAKAFRGLIVWQTKEENSKNLPTCFKQFPNVRTVLDCTEFKTANIACLTCRTCTYSHYKGGYYAESSSRIKPAWVC